MTQLWFGLSDWNWRFKNLYSIKYPTCRYNIYHDKWSVADGISLWFNRQTMCFAGAIFCRRKPGEIFRNTASESWLTPCCIWIRQVANGDFCLTISLRMQPFGHFTAVLQGLDFGKRWWCTLLNNPEQARRSAHAHLLAYWLAERKNSISGRGMRYWWRKKRKGENDTLSQIWWVICSI